MKQTYICNGCGREMNRREQDFLHVQKEWGYFSNKDLEFHEFYLCEDCYDKLLSVLEIPVKIEEVTEV
jgi:ribosomal-protein-alanine N-acetyltransferase